MKSCHLFIGASQVRYVQWGGQGFHHFRHWENWVQRNVHWFHFQFASHHHHHHQVELITLVRQELFLATECHQKIVMSVVCMVFHVSQLKIQIVWHHYVMHCAPKVRNNTTANASQLPMLGSSCISTFLFQNFRHQERRDTVSESFISYSDKHEHLNSVLQYLQIFTHCCLPKKSEAPRTQWKLSAGLNVRLRDIARVMQLVCLCSAWFQTLVRQVRGWKLNIEKLMEKCGFECDLLHLFGMFYGIFWFSQMKKWGHDLLVFRSRKLVKAKWSCSDCVRVFGF